MGALVECPHCGTHVVPRRDGRCPSCQEDVAAPSGKGDGPYRRTQAAAAAAPHSGVRSVEMREGAALPKVCLLCGDATEKTEALELKLEHGVAPPLRTAGLLFAATATGVFASVVYRIYWLAFLLGLIAMITAMFIRTWLWARHVNRDGPQDRVVVLRIPRCPACAGKPLPEPAHVDYDAGLARFDLPTAIADRFEGYA